MSAREQLVEAITSPRVYDDPFPNIAEAQLEAAREVVAERREQIPVLRRRADEAGIGEVRTLDDLVPLLFAHTSYKSYPASFVEQGRWDRMLQWLQTLSTARVTDVDVSGVRDVDDWIDRLRDAGHMILATSGTTGKVSFLNHTQRDAELKRRNYGRMTGFPRLQADGGRNVFYAGPSVGPNSAIESYHNNAAAWAKPGGEHYLTDEPLKLAEVSRMAQLRARMADGQATPGEIREAEATARAKADRMSAAMDVFVDALLDHRHEPIVLSALWAQHMTIIDRARERGIADGDFHPQTLISAGGGLKGVTLPDDYRERVDRFYGEVVRMNGYGMTELASTMPRCEAMRYHRPPSIIWLLLDDEGERLLPQDGVQTGRFGFLDLIYEGRWGGLISGDKVTVDFAETCPCGRAGPTILDTISRFTQPGESDHIGCAGTIDGYIRGALSA